MAFYRNVSINFWSDSKIDDEFTPEDKYFFLYLLTNPHTNICGCYEISIKQMCVETGYNDDTVKRLLKRMETEHNVIRYDNNTKEVLIINWSKYNWSSSDKVNKAVYKVAQRIKSESFKDIVIKLIEKKIDISYIQNTVSETDTETDTAVDVSIGYQYPMDNISEKAKKKPPTAIDMVINNYTDNEKLITAIKDFSKFRKAIKAPMTDRALQLCLNKLDKLADTDELKIAILEQSIERGWKGLYPLKEEQKQEESSDMSKYDFVINNF